MKRRFDHVLVDLDNTILDFAVCEKAILEAMALEYGFMPVTTEGKDLTRTYRVINAELWRQYEKGHIASEELRLERFRRLAAVLDTSALARPLDPAFLNEQFVARLSRCATLVPTADAVVKKIGPVSVVTNGFANVQHPRIERSGLAPYFDHVFISEEIGAAKPQKAFFDHVLAELGDPDPARCVVIGDSLSSDIAGGRAAGMHTVWFDRREMLGEPVVSVPADRAADAHITRLVELYGIVLAD